MPRSVQSRTATKPIAHFHAFLQRPACDRLVKQLLLKCSCILEAASRRIRSVTGVPLQCEMIVSDVGSGTK